jgi:hypothetical protein
LVAAEAVADVVAGLGMVRAVVTVNQALPTDADLVRAVELLHTDR